MNNNICTPVNGDVNLKLIRNIIDHLVSDVGELLEITEEFPSLLCNAKQIAAILNIMAIEVPDINAITS